MLTKRGFKSLAYHGGMLNRTNIFFYLFYEFQFKKVIIFYYFLRIKNFRPYISSRAVVEWWVPMRLCYCVVWNGSRQGNCTCCGALGLATECCSLLPGLLQVLFYGLVTTKVTKKKLRGTIHIVYSLIYKYFYYIIYIYIFFRSGKKFLGILYSN